MKSITKIYEAGENNKSVAEAVVLSALDIAVASSLGVFADILAAIIDITGAMADTAPDKSLKVNYIPAASGSNIAPSSKYPLFFNNS